MHRLEMQLARLCKDGDHPMSEGIAPVSKVFPEPRGTSALARRPSGSRRRILFVISTLGGGTGTHVVRLLGSMDPEAWDLRLLCNGTRELDPPEAVKVIEDRGSGVFHRFPIAQWRQLRAMRQMIQAVEPDLVHTYFFWPIIYGRLLKREGTISRLVENREDQGFAWAPWQYTVLRRTAHLPDRIICVSEAVRRVVLDREGLPPERVRVIRNGVPGPESTSTRGDPEPLRAELGFRGDELVVGMVANLNRAVKGVGYFLDAMPPILDEIPNVRFLLVGDGPDRARLMRQAEELGVGPRVVFAGFRPDVERFYSIMTLSVLTSLSEGLSMTLLESMSSGLPVVATHVGGNPELVKHGQTGLLVPPRDPAAFAEAVVRLLRSPELRRRMGKSAQSLVRTEFSVQQVAVRYQENYQSLLRGSNR